MFTDSAAIDATSSPRPSAVRRSGGMLAYQCRLIWPRNFAPSHKNDVKTSTPKAGMFFKISHLSENLVSPKAGMFLRMNKLHFSPKAETGFLRKPVNKRRNSFSVSSIAGLRSRARGLCRPTLSHFRPIPSLTREELLLQPAGCLKRFRQRTKLERGCRGYRAVRSAGRPPAALFATRALSRTNSGAMPRVKPQQNSTFRRYAPLGCAATAVKHAQSCAGRPSRLVVCREDRHSEERLRGTGKRAGPRTASRIGFNSVDRGCVYGRHARSLRSFH
jgi:hypothetical protein